MKIAVATAGMPHQRAWGETLAAGLRALGYEPVAIQAGEAAATAVVACWGWRVGSGYRAQGHDVLVAERGYLGDRFAWTGLAWNGLNGRGAFPVIDDHGRRLAERHVRPAPYQVRRPELPALIVGQVPGDMSIAGVDIEAWYRKMAREWAPAVYRAHPVAVARGLGAFERGAGPKGLEDLAGVTLAEAFARVRRVVTWNSNTAVDALMAGMPVEVYDEGGMAWPAWTGRVTRERLLARLAWCQWLQEEIADGSALEAVLAADRTARWCDQRQPGATAEVAA